MLCYYHSVEWRPRIAGTRCCSMRRRHASTDHEDVNSIEFWREGRVASQKNSRNESHICISFARCTGSNTKMRISTGRWWAWIDAGSHKKVKICRRKMSRNFLFFFFYIVTGGGGKGETAQGGKNQGQWREREREREGDEKGIDLNRFFVFLTFSWSAWMRSPSRIRWCIEAWIFCENCLTTRWAVRWYNSKLSTTASTTKFMEPALVLSKSVGYLKYFYYWFFLNRLGVVPLLSVFGVSVRVQQKRNEMKKKKTFTIKRCTSKRAGGISFQRWWRRTSSTVTRIRAKIEW